MESIDYTAKLNDYGQKFDCEVEYEDVGSEGPGHIKTFTQRVIFNGKPYPKGVGKNKREARQNAAKHALESVLPTASNHSHVSGRSVRDATETINLPKLTQPNYRCWLNDHSQKNRVPILALESTAVGHAIPCCKFVIDGTEYPSGSGRTKKEAKEEAARLAYEEIRRNPPSNTVDQSGSVEPSSPQTNELNQDMSEAMVVSGGKEHPEVKRKTTTGAKQWPAKGSWKSAKSEEDGTSNIATSDVASSASDSWNNSSAPPQEEKLGSKAKIKFLEEYDNIEPIERGGFGQVYKARWKHLDKYYAVKKVPNKENALREAAVLADLQHPNIVRYYDSWNEDHEKSSSQSSSDTSGGYLYIKMELCDMKNLDVWIEEKNSLHKDPTRREESLDIMKKMIRGVEYIHSKNLMHRDIKPSNIMVGLDGEVKIVDFGLVTAESDEEGNMLEKTIGTGTPSFMPPEQRYKNVYNNKVDIFASGLVYFLMLWNISSHERSKRWEDIRKQKIPANFTRSFLEESLLIKTMLHENPESRPSAGAITANLEQLDTETPTKTNSNEPKLRWNLHVPVEDYS